MLLSLFSMAEYKSTDFTIFLVHHMKSDFLGFLTSNVINRRKMRAEKKFLVAENWIETRVKVNYKRFSCRWRLLDNWRVNGRNILSASQKAIFIKVSQLILLMGSELDIYWCWRRNINRLTLIKNQLMGILKAFANGRSIIAILWIWKLERMEISRRKLLEAFRWWRKVYRAENR